MSWARTARIALALALLGLAGGGATAESENARQAWTEIDWPFLLDQWGTGRAFRCEGPGCGAERVFVPFAVETGDGATRQAISAVVSKDCEALVATLILSRDGPVSIEPSLLLPGTMNANLP